MRTDDQLTRTGGSLQAHRAGGAARHADRTRVVVSVEADDRTGTVVVEVSDDGVGFDPATVAEGSGLASMRLFTGVGRGELTVRSAPGDGTVVRSRLGGRATTTRATTTGRPEPAATSAASLASPPSGGRHLRLVPTLDKPAGVA